MPRATHPLFFASLAALCAACGGSVGTTAPPVDQDSGTTLDSTNGDSNGQDSSQEDSPPGQDSVAVDSNPFEEGIDTAPVDTGTASCPANEPPKGSACPRVGLACGYGSDPRPNCNPIATCTASGWAISTPDPSCATTPPTCPDKEPTGACSSLGEVCAYGADACTCQCGPVCGPAGGFWACQTPPSGCPTTPPNVGTACSEPGLSCPFQCGPDGARKCEDGTWKLADGGPCPVSTRTAKRDIEYLDDAAVASLARQVESMKLASWIYKNPALNGDRTHMGIILEDLPAGSYAADPRAQVVDLYGYTSMLVATVQTQQKELDRQKSQLDAMQQQLDAFRKSTTGK